MSYFGICVETLARRQIADPFVRKFCGRHHLDYVETSPANIIPQHLKLDKREGIVLVVSET